MIRVIGLGAGGHAKVLIDILRRAGDFEIVGLLDPARAGEIIAGVPILGDDEQLHTMRISGVTAVFIGVGGVGDNSIRMALYEKALAAKFDLVNAIHPTAIVAPSVKFGQGVAIMAGAILNPDVRIGDNVIINTGAIVEHDCEIGSHAHISPGAVLSGGVRVGLGAHVGVGATVRQYIQLGDGAIVGAGAVVVKDVPPRSVVVGVPARPTRS